jgi:putative Holliday junction resolvase
LKRVLALDYGDKKIGVALSDPMEIIAKPLLVIDNKNYNHVLNEVQSLIDDYSIKKIVIGLPLTLKNKKSIQTEKVLEFVDKIKVDIIVPIITYDERLTSKIAVQSLIKQGIKTGHNKKDIDKTAAAIFLQNYLDDPTQ